MTPVTLRTARLALRRWHDRHRAPFAALNADPEVMRWFPSTQGRAQSDASIDAWQAQFDERGWSNWAVELRPADDAADDTPGEFIGFVGLTVPRRPLPFSPCVEVGWRLARAHWGRGYATEAARECLRFGFGTLGLDEIVSFTTLGNAPSRAVMARIGLHDTGRDFDHPALPDGHPLQRHCLYAARRQNWLATA